MGDFDARALNWRFVVPDEPEGLLLLPIADERLPNSTAVRPGRPSLDAALRAGPYPAIVAPDVGSWSSFGGGDPVRLLTLLASSVAPGGWLYAGLANPWYPHARRGRRSLGRRAALRALRACGFEDFETYLAFPDERCPAYLVSTTRPAELEYFLRSLFLPYAGAARGWRARVRQRLLSSMRAAALLVPHGTRLRFAPALGIVARRSS